MTSKIFVFIFGKLISCKRQNNFINYHHITMRQVIHNVNLQLTTKKDSNKQSTITKNHTWKKEKEVKSV